MNARRLLLLAALSALAACGDEPRAASAKLFEDVTDTVGLDFRHGIGQTGTYHLPEIMGPGCALLDYDGDGDLDAYLVNAGPGEAGAPNRLFRQEADGRFVDVTAASGLGDDGYGMGVAVGDADGDGDLDVYLTNVGRDRLYENLGQGRFRDVTNDAGLGDDGWSCSAAFVDHDQDGDLDLFVTRYVLLDATARCHDPAGRPEYCGPRDFPGVSDKLYRNDGGLRFTDVSKPAGIAGRHDRGLGVVCADLSGDGRPDIYVANDNGPNHLWINQGGGRFLEEALERGVALNDEGREEASMGLVCADLDADGRDDLFMTHLRGETNTLYLADGDGRFSDRTAARGLAGPSRHSTGFGAAALDVEGDGDLDLIAVNGHVMRGDRALGDHLSPFWGRYAQPAQLFSNDAGHFADTSLHLGLLGRHAIVGRGLATGDVDGDGFVDVLVTAAGGRARLHLNRAPSRGSWLRVRCVEGAGARDALGAVVTVEAAGRTFRRRVDPASSYLSASDVRVTFGLGAASSYAAIVVRWPEGGEPERFPGGPTGKQVTLRKGAGQR
ncbi:MAG: hypothetical protein CMJ83_07770 [Planctomycetes bacterium]|nr:hypothetical protein [Planctomycetota bacterium]